MKTRAVVFTAKDQIEIRDVEMPPLKPDQILTETLYTFVSPGTELRTLAGHYGADKNYPFIPGYSTLCRVVETGKDVKSYRQGDVLSARSTSYFTDVAIYWGGEAGHHVYNGNEGMGGHVFIPAGEEPLKYVVTEVAAISFRGVTSADPKPGERVLVIGQGMIGFFSAILFRLKGCIVTVCDINKNRIEESLKAGFDAVDLSEPDSAERLDVFGCSGFDIVSECSGSIPGVKLAYSKIRRAQSKDAMSRTRLDWPRLLLQANYVDEISINPCWFYKGEGLTILTPGDRTLDDRQQVADLIRLGKFPTEHFTKNIFSPDEMPDAYRKLQKREINSVVCKWR